MFDPNESLIKKEDKVSHKQKIYRKIYSFLAYFVRRLRRLEKHFEQRAWYRDFYLRGLIGTIKIEANGQSVEFKAEDNLYIEISEGENKMTFKDYRTSSLAGTKEYEISDVGRKKGGNFSTLRLEFTNN